MLLNLRVGRKRLRAEDIQEKRLGVGAARLASMRADAQAARLPQLRQYLKEKKNGWV
jgi:hypothetical protein